jgi:hypothetical protein
MEAFWKIFQTRKSPRIFEEGVDYSFVEIENVDVSAVKLLKGEYKDVIYCYGKASVNEEGVAARLKFDYIIVDSCKYSVEELIQDEKFHTIIGDILVEMITVEGQNE